MSISLVAALAGTLAAAVGTVVLAVRCARAPRADLIAWAIATAGLTIALAAQALGYRRGFAPTTFRAVQIGAQLIAPLALAWGIAEVAARSLPARFTARLVFAALAVVAGVIMGSDVLSSQAFGQSWPAASVYYQVIPKALLTLLAAVAVLTAVLGAIVAGVRARGNRAWRDAFVAVGVAGVATVATEGLAVHLPANSGYPALCVLAAGLAVLASLLASRFQPAALRAAGGPGDDTGWGPAVPAGARRSRPYGADDSLGLYRDSGHGGYPAAAGGYGQTGDDGAYGGAGHGEPDTGYREPEPGYGGPDTGGFDGPVTGAFDPLYQQNGYPDRTGRNDYQQYGADAGHLPAERGGSAAEEPAGAWRPGSYSDGENTGPGAVTPAALVLGAAGLAGEHDTERLYGQIAIYTLLEHGAAEFDRLADRVVEQVRVHEPGTLVYVVHGVPSAPLQRILYEVYRDQAAYDEHTQQSYIREFEVGRRPLVLATNVIELGVRQAKVSPLGPSPGPVAGPVAGPSRRPAAEPSRGPSPEPPPGSPGPLPARRPYGAAPGGRTRGDRPPGGRVP